VIINERGIVKVLDFGLAKLIGEEQEIDQNAATLAGVKTRSNVMLGTPLYLSPEQAKALPVDGRSDIFSLGALLYESIAGRPAFSGATVVEIAAQVIHVNPEPPSKFNRLIPPELDRITLKAISKRPEDRYQTAEEFIADLRALSFHFSELDDTRTPSMTSYSSGAYHTSAHRATSLTTLSDNLRRPRLSIATVLIGVAVLMLVGWGASRWLRPTPHTPTQQAQAEYDLGTNLLRAGAYYQASTHLRYAAELDDKFVLAHARLAEAFTELDNADSASVSMLRAESHSVERDNLSPVDALRFDAIRATITRNYARAVADYQQIARLLPDRTDTYVDLGRAYEKMEQSKKAIESYIEATNRDAKHATAYLRVGILYARLGENASAASNYDIAEKIYKEFANNEGQTEVLHRRGALLRNIGKLDEARRQLEQGLEMAKAGGNVAQHINMLLQLSAVATNKNDAAGAQSYARAAVELAQKNDMGTLVALGNVDLGLTFMASNKDAEAEQYLKQGLDAARRYNAKRAEAKALINLGSIYIRQGNTDEGLRLVEQALDFYRSGGYRKEEAQARAMLGRAKRQKGNYTEALNDFQQVLEFSKQVGDPTLISTAHVEVGNVLAHQENYLEALKHFEASCNIEKSLGRELYAGYSFHNRSEMLWRLGRFAEAREMLNQVVAVAEKPDIKAKNQELLAHSYLTQANMALSENHYGDAQAKSEQALSAVGDANKSLAIEAKRTLGLAHSYAGATAKGKLLCEEALATAKLTGDPWLVSCSLLALAKTQLLNGDAPGALSSAQEAQASFARSGQKVSEWRAWFVAARASQRAGNLEAARDYASRATNLLAELQQMWGAAAFEIYQARPDVQLGRKQLAELSAGVR
jgi:tetratricopeptide (TPR) repeat protein